MQVWTFRPGSIPSLDGSWVLWILAKFVVMGEECNISFLRFAGGFEWWPLAVGVAVSTPISSAASTFSDFELSAAGVADGRRRLGYDRRDSGSASVSFLCPAPTHYRAGRGLPSVKYRAADFFDRGDP